MGKTVSRAITPREIFFFSLGKKIIPGYYITIISNPNYESNPIYRKMLILTKGQLLQGQQIDFEALIRMLKYLSHYHLPRI